MSNLDLLRKGLSALADGDISTISSHLRQTVNAHLEPNDLVEIVSYEDTPAWIESPDRVAVIKDTSGTRKYQSVFEESQSAQLSSEDGFSTVEVTLRQYHLADEITVKASFDTSDGETRTRTKTISPDSAFESRRPLSCVVEIDGVATSCDLEFTCDYAEEQENDDLGFRIKSLLAKRFSGKDYLRDNRVQMSVPAIRGGDEQPPIFLISIDTLKHDLDTELSPLIDSLGDTAIIPREPRTKGYWTVPSHASMVTGVHPGTHRMVGGYDGYQELPTDLVTLSEVLADNQYKCSALTSRPVLDPTSGYARGFHRYEVHEMRDLGDWIDRDTDVQTDLAKLLRWIDADRSRGTDSLFYFWHIFDPHAPYIPPQSRDVSTDLDMAAITDYNETVHSVDAGPDYVQLLNTDLDIPEKTIEMLREFYRESVSYTAENVAWFIEELKHREIFDQALIIITGDHGEEFGERGLYSHNSLYDANIRQFMAVKPPATADWTVPEDPDTTDILPTIAREIGVEPPQQCHGRAWQDSGKLEGYRITERIRMDWYNIAVEKDGKKAIFTYSENYPDRPTEAQLEQGPILEEFYITGRVRDGDYSDYEEEFTAEEIEVRLNVAESFVREKASPSKSPNGSSKTKPDMGTKEQLKHLGYMDE